jgi:hypothetical protein
MLLLKISLLFVVATSIDASSCATLAATSTADGLNLACLGVVDYSYYLPTNFSTSALNTIAKTQLADSKLAILPASCQVALKKLVCSNVYLKCPPNIVLTDTTTYAGWNFGIYSDVGKAIPVPFQRPCKQVKVCGDVHPNKSFIVNFCEI